MRLWPRTKHTGAPRCGLQWENTRRSEEDHPTHTCSRYAGHRDKHICNCNCSKQPVVESDFAGPHSRPL